MALIYHNTTAELIAALRSPLPSTNETTARPPLSFSMPWLNLDLRSRPRRNNYLVKTQTVSFKQLPPEVREIIYHAVLTSYTGTLPLGRPWLPALSLTCREVQAEMMPILLAKYTTVLDLSLSQIATNFPPLSRILRTWMSRNVDASQNIRSLEVAFMVRWRTRCTLHIKVQDVRTDGTQVAGIVPKQFLRIDWKFHNMIFEDTEVNAVVSRMRKDVHHSLASNDTGFLGLNELNTILTALCSLDRLETFYYPLEKGKQTGDDRTFSWHFFPKDNQDEQIVDHQESGSSSFWRHHPVWVPAVPTRACFLQSDA